MVWASVAEITKKENRSSVFFIGGILVGLLLSCAGLVVLTYKILLITLHGARLFFALFALE